MDNLETPNLETQTPQEFKTPSKTLLIVLPIIFFISVSLLIAFQIDASKNLMLTYAESLGLYEKPKVKSTFYQWVDAKGKLIISKNKPNHTQDFVVIEADSNLLTNNNRVDQELLAKSAAFKNSEENAEPAKENTSSDGSLSSYASSFQKAKHCIEMSQKVAAVNRELKQDKESNDLRARHKKECIDNFEIQ